MSNGVLLERQNKAIIIIIIINSKHQPPGIERPPPRASRRLAALLCEEVHGVCVLAPCVCLSLSVAHAHAQEGLADVEIVEPLPEVRPLVREHDLSERGVRHLDRER